MLNKRSLILRFSGSSGIISSLVKTYTWSWASHVETIIDDPIKGKQLFGALPNTGVNYRPIDSTNGYKVEDYEVLMSSFRLHQYFEKILSQIGKPYDYAAIFSILFHRDRNWKNNDAWFCSELTAWVFSEIGLPLLRTEHLNRVTPADLLLSPLLHRIS